MASLDKNKVLISTPDHTPPTTNSPLLQTTPESHLAIFETLDEGTSMLLSLTCKYFYKIHRAFHNSPTSLLTKSIAKTIHHALPHCFPNDRYLLINYLADWFPKEPTNTIVLATKCSTDASWYFINTSSKVIAVGTKRRKEEYEGDFAPESLPTLPRFRHIKILVLVLNFRYPDTEVPYDGWDDLDPLLDVTRVCQLIR